MAKNIMKLFYITGVVVLVVLCAFYAGYRLTESPPTWYDEGLYVQAARSIAYYGTQTIQIAPDTFVGSGFVSGGYPFLAPVALSLTLFGDNLLAARIPMVGFIFLFACAAWLLTYRVGGWHEALIALLLIVTLPLLYGNGKNVLGEVPGLLYTTLFLLALLRIESHRFEGKGNYLLAGLTLGLAAATKPIFFLLPIAVGLVILMRIRSTPLKWKEIGWGLLAFGLALALWGYLQFGAGDQAVSVLSQYANPYSQIAIFSVVKENILRFFTELTPLYLLTLMGLWTLALGVRKYRTEKISYTEMTAFVFSALIVVAYLRTPGWYRYFFEALVLALVFAPHALRVVFDACAKHLPALTRFRPYIWVPLVLLACIQLYQLNFSSWVAEHYTDTTHAQTAAHIASIPSEAVLFVYNVPEALIYTHTRKYYQYIEQPGGDVGLEALEALKEGIPDIVLVSPLAYEERKDLFAEYQNAQPAGAYMILSK